MKFEFSTFSENWKSHKFNFIAHSLKSLKWYQIDGISLSSLKSLKEYKIDLELLKIGNFPQNFSQFFQTYRFKQYVS